MLSKLKARLAWLSSSLDMQIVQLRNGKVRSGSKLTKDRRHELSHGSPQFHCLHQACGKSFYRQDLLERHTGLRQLVFYTLYAPLMRCLMSCVALSTIKSSHLQALYRPAASTKASKARLKKKGFHLVELQYQFNLF
jgi:hypothetical protein